jgi:Transglutaminase-like superfamily
MDASVEHTVQLRRAARRRTDALRGHTFEIAAVLSVALIVATSWAVLAAGWVKGGGGAVVVAATSVVEAALLAHARAPRIAAAIAVPFLGLAAIVPTTLAAMPSVSSQTVGTIAGHYERALVNGLSSTQDWDFTVGLCAVLFLCGYWLGWMVLREHRGVLAVIPIFSVLATNVINARTTDPIAAPEMIAVCLALGVVGAAHLGSLGDQWTSSRITALGDLGWRFGTSAAGVAVVVTIVALLIPPASSIDISARLFPHGIGSGTGGSGTETTTLGGVSTIGFNPAVQLGGQLISHPQLVMTYTVNTSVPVYLRLADDVLFKDGGNWDPQIGNSVADSETWSGVAYQIAPLPRDSRPSDGGISADQQTVTANIVMQKGATGDQPLVPFAGDPAAVSLAGIAYGIVHPADRSHLLTVDQVLLDRSIAAGTAVQTTAFVSTATEAQLRAAGTDYPGWTKPYSSLPANGGKSVATIHSLALQWTLGAKNPYDKAIAIEDHLRDFQYTLTPTQASDPAVWPLVYFLTVSHQGYCQYFASAMGSMLRSLGIPTRLVSGYGPGTTRAQNGRQGQRQQVLTTSDAHDWVEAYFPGYGWIPFEPTPPSVQGNYEPFLRGQPAVTGANRGPVASAKAVPTTKPRNLAGPSIPLAKGPGAHAGVPMPVLISLAALGGIAALIGAALLWLALPRSPAGAWRRVETLGVLSGVDRRGAETHRAFAARLARARPRAGPSLSELATVTARAEFGATRASPNERAQALRTWRRVLINAPLRPRKSPR